MNEEDYYIDDKGYKRFTNSGKSVHRYIAKKNIWEKDRKKYPLEFNEYQVHHKNKIKTDNRQDNLELIEVREHEKKHNIQRYEYPVIKTLAVFGLIMLSWFLYLGLVSHYKYTWNDVIFMVSTTILGGVIFYLINKKKEGVKYV